VSIRQRGVLAGARIAARGSRNDRLREAAVDQGPPWRDVVAELEPIPISEIAG
jgi:hypothetical protein